MPMPRFSHVRNTMVALCCNFRFLLIGLEKFEKVLQIIIDYDDSSTR